MTNGSHLAHACVARILGSHLSYGRSHVAGRRYTWLGTDEAPLPFDVAYAPKPAFDALLAVLVK